MFSTEIRDRQGKVKLSCCLGGCAGVVAVACAVVALIFYYGTRAMPVVPPETFLKAGTDAFAIVRVHAEDEGLAALLADVGRNPPEAWDLPAERREQIKKQAESVKELLAKAGPLQLVLIGTYDEKEKKVLCEGAFSIRGWSGFLRWGFNWIAGKAAKTAGEPSAYKGVKIGTGDKGFRFAVKGNNFMFARSLETIKNWIDALEQQGPAAEAGQEVQVAAFQGRQVMKALYEGLAAEAPVRFVVMNGQGEIEALAGETKDEKLIKAVQNLGVTSRAVLGVAGRMKVLISGALEVELVARCADDGAARKLSAALSAAAPALEEEYQLEEARITGEGVEVRVSFRVPGLRERFLDTQGTAEKPLEPARDEQSSAAEEQ